MKIRIDNVVMSITSFAVDPKPIDRHYFGMARTLVHFEARSEDGQPLKDTAATWRAVRTAVEEKLCTFGRTTSKIEIGSVAVSVAAFDVDTKPTQDHHFGIARTLVHFEARDKDGQPLKNTPATWRAVQDALEQKLESSTRSAARKRARMNVDKATR